MIQNKAAFIISMFDEYEVVLKTIWTINKNYREPHIIVVRSDGVKNTALWEKIKFLSTTYVVLPNLVKKIDRFALPAHAVSRNYSKGFSLLNTAAEYIVSILGDTLIYNPRPLHRKAMEMLKEKKYLCCSKAYGQYFNSKKSTAKRLISDRFQDSDSTDFVPQLFIVNGNTFERKKLFTNIKVTNKFTTEQCLGDETLRHYSKNEILSKTLLLNAKNPTFCYSFTDGITYHAVSGKPGR